MKNLFSLLSLLFVLVSMGCGSHKQSSDLQDAPLRAFYCGGPEDDDRANPQHCEGNFVVEGNWNFNPGLIAERYRKHIHNEDDDSKTYLDVAPASPHTFGTFKLKVPPINGQIKSGTTGRPKFLRELHYHLGNNRIGMRLLPIVDREGSPYRELDDGYYEPWPGTEESPNPFYDYTTENEKLWRVMGKDKAGKEISVFGSEEVDKALRLAQGYEADDQNLSIFAVTTFTHPENHEGTIFDLLEPDNLKFENSITHMGAYIGEGQTRNSPYLYGDQRWTNEGYPVILSTVQLEGVEPEVLNYNMVATLDILNEFGLGVEFPENYKTDPFRAINLKETLNFIRGWIDNDWIREGDSEPFYKLLTEDDTYRTYCAEHITIVVNLGLNLPQNKKGYHDVWPEAADPSDKRCQGQGSVGECLWKIASEKYLDHFGIDLEPASEFTPLWQLNGISNPTKEEAWGKSLAWPIETTADLVANFLENYLNWTDEGVSPFYSVGALVALMPIILDRMKITEAEYLSLVYKPAALILKHASTVKNHPILDNLYFDFAKRAALYTHINTTVRGLLWAELQAISVVMKSKFGYTAPDLNKWVIDPVLKELSKDESMDYMVGHLGKSKRLAPTEAWDAFRTEVRKYKEKARRQQGGTDGSGEIPVTHYSPPGIIHRVTSNMHPHDPFVTITEIGTALDAEELCYVDRNETVYDLLKSLPKSFKCTDDPKKVQK